LYVFNIFYLEKCYKVETEREGKKITLAAARLFAAANLSKLFLKRKNEETKQRKVYSGQFLYILEAPFTFLFQFNVNVSLSSPCIDLEVGLVFT